MFQCSDRGSQHSSSKHSYPLSQASFSLMGRPSLISNGSMGRVIGLRKRRPRTRISHSVYLYDNVRGRSRYDVLPVNLQVKLKTQDVETTPASGRGLFGGDSDSTRVQSRQQIRFLSVTDFTRSTSRRRCETQYHVWIGLVGRIS